MFGVCVYIHAYIRIDCRPAQSFMSAVIRYVCVFVVCAYMHAYIHTYVWIPGPRSLSCLQ